MDCGKLPDGRYEVPECQHQGREAGNRTAYRHDNSFEWRFEFPEVPDQDRDFSGFDVVIGNPPYIRQEELLPIKLWLKDNYETFAGIADLYVYLIEGGNQILRQKGRFAFIVPN